MFRKVFFLVLTISVGLIGTLRFAQAVPVYPVIKLCLDKTIGMKAANKIVAAKKLTKKQTQQVAKCKSSAKRGG